jgi:hypothetical protein
VLHYHTPGKAGLANRCNNIMCPPLYYTVGPKGFLLTHAVTKEYRLLYALSFDLTTPQVIDHFAITSLHSAMLCPFCEDIRSQDPRKGWLLKHYPSYSDLANSVDKGCKLCRVFKTILLEQYSAKLACSLEEAEKFHLRADDENLSKEEDQREQFFVKPWHENLDTRSAPFEHGLKSLLFVRWRDESKNPLERVFPYVSVSVSSGSCAAE